MLLKASRRCCSSYPKPSRKSIPKILHQPSKVNFEKQRAQCGDTETDNLRRARQFQQIRRVSLQSEEIDISNAESRQDTSGRGVTARTRRTYCSEAEDMKIPTKMMKKSRTRMRKDSTLAIIKWEIIAPQKISSSRKETQTQSDSLPANGLYLGQSRNRRPNRTNNTA